MRARGVRWILHAFVVAACALVAWNIYSTQRARADEPPYFAIRNARIVPVSGPVIPSGTVVVAKGLIQAVGANATIPPEARVIDGTGLTVYPGLIDAGTDVGTGAAAAPAQGAGGRGGGGGGRGAVATNAPLSRGPEDRPATTPWENAADQLKSDDARIATWRGAGFTTGMVVPRGGYFPGQAALVDFGEADRAEELVVKTPVALPISLQGGRGEYQGFPGALMGQLSYVRQVFIDAQWYAQAQQTYEAHPQGNSRPAYDHTNVVISHALANKELVLWPGNSDIDIARALKMAPTIGARWALTGAQQGYEMADAIAAAHVPVLINVNWPAPPPGGNSGGEDTEPLRTLRFRDRAPSTPAALNKAGVKFAFASEGIASPKDILRNINKAITAGLPADAALRALTLGAAEILGVSDRMGSIEPGKIANLVVTDGDIFADATKVKWVFVDGNGFIPPPTPEPTPGAGRGGGAPGANDMTGNWTFYYTTDNGPDQSTANLQMAADGTITGTLTSQLGTAPIIRGQLTGNQFRISIQVPIEGTPMDVTLSGTITGNQVSGTIDVMGMSISFTGKRPSTGAEEVRQ
jgi:Amidohydrolase family